MVQSSANPDGRSQDFDRGLTRNTAGNSRARRLAGPFCIPSVELLLSGQFPAGGFRRRESGRPAPRDHRSNSRLLALVQFSPRRDAYARAPHPLRELDSGSEKLRAKHWTPWEGSTSSRATPSCSTDGSACERRCGSSRHRAGADGREAAGALVGQETALAIVPGGTLNHFARDHGIPTDHTKAAELSANGETTTTDVATVNGRVFLNTSSVGAYVVFVRTRERLERHFGYRIATLSAGLRLLGRVRPFTVEMKLDGQVRRYRSALVFVGVGERELQLPSIGSRAENGRRGLHVIVVRGGTWARLVAAGLVAAFRGNDAIKRDKLADSYIADECRIEFRRRLGSRRGRWRDRRDELAAHVSHRARCTWLIVPSADTVYDWTPRHAR